MFLFRGGEAADALQRPQHTGALHYDLIVGRESLDQPRAPHPRQRPHRHRLIVKAGGATRAVTAIDVGALFRIDQCLGRHQQPRRRGGLQPHLDAGAGPERARSALELQQPAGRLRGPIGARQRPENPRADIHAVDHHHGVAVDGAAEGVRGNIGAHQELPAVGERLEQRAPLAGAPARQRSPLQAEAECRGPRLRGGFRRLRLRRLRSLQGYLSIVSIEMLESRRLRLRRGRGDARCLHAPHVVRQRNRIQHRAVRLDLWRTAERQRLLDANAHGLLLRGCQRKLRRRPPQRLGVVVRVRPRLQRTGPPAGRQHEPRSQRPRRHCASSPSSGR